jgi:hypothetical protein
VKRPTKFALELTFAVSAVVGLVLLSTGQLSAQQGDNAVYQTSTALAASPAFIDVTALKNGDICNTINSILTGPTYPATGAVIDARGFLPSGSNGFSGPQSCGSNPFSSVNKPSTVLLPASTLLLAVPWILPKNTRVVGEGPNTVLRACSTTGQQPCSSNFGGSDMIDMGSSSFCTSACSGISVEHLTLDGNGQNGIVVNGIVNQYAQEASFVNDVGMTNVLSTGISVVGPNANVPGATGSGPYSNISYGCPLSPFCPNSPSPVCVNITATTLGLHGITCVANSSPKQAQPAAAILLDANNNSIEDVHIEGFYDGVLIGSQGSAQGNVLINIYGGFGNGPLTNTVHVCKASTSTTNCPIHSGSVTDLVLLQIESVGDDGKNPPFYAASILDDLSATEPTNYIRANAYVGMYVIGNNNGETAEYSRFTTSPGTNFYNPNSLIGVPTWAIGSANNIHGTACNTSGSGTTPGTVYSSTNGVKGSNNTLFVCKGGIWQAVSM